MRSPIFTSFKALLATGFGISLLLFAGGLQADTLVVQPSKLELSAVKPVTSLTVRNNASEERTIHMNISAWQQDGVRDQLIPSNKLLVLPEKVRLQPGESASVRVALKLSGPLWEEMAFQLQLTEVPKIPDIGSKQPPPDKSSTPRRSSVPVFLLPPGTVNPRISWTVDRGSDGTVTLSARNSGRAHIELHSASLSGPVGQRFEMRRLSAVILPGGTRSWTLMDDATGGLWQLTAMTNAGPMQAELELGPNFSSSPSLTQAE